MNTKIQAIEFNNYIDLAELFKKYNYSFDEYVTMQVGYDEKIYILFNEHIPERIDGMFVPAESNSRFSVLELEPNWYEGTVINEKLYHLGTQEMNHSFIQPVPGGFLLVSARCRYNKGNPDHNAVIVDLDGNKMDEFCLGDGISQCMFHPELGIVTGYFDEGIFGNYGWEEPLGEYGVRVWGKDGRDIWKADKEIYDCYALNISEAGDIWYYYYNEFKLVKENIHTSDEREFDPGISGSNSLVISEDNATVILDQGYDAQEEYAAINILGNGSCDPVPLSFTYKGNSCELYLISSFGSKAAFVENGTHLFIKKI